MSSALAAALACSWLLRFFRSVSGTRIWSLVGTELISQNNWIQGQYSLSRTKSTWNEPRRVEELQHIAPHSRTEAVGKEEKLDGMYLISEIQSLRGFLNAITTNSSVRHTSQSEDMVLSQIVPQSENFSSDKTQSQWLRKKLLA